MHWIFAQVHPVVRLSYPVCVLKGTAIKRYAYRSRFICTFSRVKKKFVTYGDFTGRRARRNIMPDSSIRADTRP